VAVTLTLAVTEPVTACVPVVEGVDVHVFVFVCVCDAERETVGVPVTELLPEGARDAVIVLLGVFVAVSVPELLIERETLKELVRVFELVPELDRERESVAV
jgi:hypothetical protein